MIFQLFAVTDDGPCAIPFPDDAQTIHDLLRGLPLGVYSALRTFDHHKFLGLEAHLDRTEHSMCLLGWDYHLDRSRLCRALDQVCRSYPLADARVRIDILAGPAIARGSDSRELIALGPYQPIPPHLLQHGVQVDVAARLRREAPDIKHASFVLEREPYALGSPQAYEHLLLGEDGALLEGTSSNFFAVRDGVIYTAEKGVLAGITRRIVLELVERLALPLQLQPIRLADVPELDEAFMSSSSRGIAPIVRIAGQVVAAGEPGPVTRKLQKAYQAYIAQAVRPAV